MDRRRLTLAIASVLTLLLAGVVGYAVRPRTAPPPQAALPDAAAVADAALLALRDEGRVVAYTGRYVAAVPGEERLLGLLGRSTFLVPGTVRYGVDLTRLKRSDLAWDAPTRTLTVTLPPLELSAPTLDLGGGSVVGEGAANSVAGLDDAKRHAASDDILRQARQPAPVAAARDAAMRLTASAFAMPLRAGGVEASVEVRFLDPAGKEEAAFLDRPRRLEQSLRDRAAGPAAGPAIGLANSAAAPK